jgi:hypothetical protein
MRHTWFTSLLLAGAALLGLASLATAAANFAPPVTRSLAIGDQTAPTGTFSGTVKQNGPTLIVHATDGDHQLTVAPGSPVLRDGKATTIDQLKQGDKVTATLNAQGVATRLDARPRGTSAGDVLQWLLPLLVVVALVVAALWWILGPRRSHRESLHGRLHHA